MNATNGVQHFDLSGPISIELLSEEECLRISGGGPMAVGCLLLAGGAGMLAVGVIVGVALYALMN